MIKIDLNKASDQYESFYDSRAWHSGYNTGLFTVTDIFSEAVYKQGATIEQVKKLIQLIRLNTITSESAPVVKQMPDGTEI